MKASITSDMFNYSFKPEMSRKLQLFAEHGFEYIHWCDDWNNDVLYVQQDIELHRQLIESAGLKCIDVHGAATRTIRIDAAEEDSLNRYIQLLENRIEFCAAVGGDAVVIHPPSDEGGSEDLGKRLNRSLRVFQSVRSLCEGLDIALAVENCYSTDEAVLDHYFKRYPPEFVGFCLDSGHAHVNGNLDQLLKFGERLEALHLHDSKGKRDDHQPPFWGTIDWEKVMLWIGESGYAKPVNFEITHNPDFFNGTMEEFLEYTVNAVQKAMTLLRC